MQTMLTNRWGGIRVFHIVIVSLSLLLTLFAWQFSKSQSEKQIALRFEVARDTTVALITDRMSRYEDALWGGVAAVESHGGNISYDQWHTYARTLRIEQKYPGINGIGVIHFKTAQTLEAYLLHQQELRPDFGIFPEHDETVYMPITFVEPEIANAAAIGLDVAHEKNRRQAAQASADTGRAHITGPITLVQDAGATPGFLFYAPFYEGEAPDTVEARRERILGAVYAPFVVHKLMDGLLAKDLRTVRLSIKDGVTEIYDEHEQSDQQTDPNPIFREQVEIDLYGRTWVVDIRSNLGFRSDNSLNQSTFILIGGLLIEALIIALFLMMASANKRAISYADRATVGLKEEKRLLDIANKELCLKNEDIEQYAYIASHDLKTPLRGINGLTEMIEEDLASYFTSTEANPEVKDNLLLIRQRVLHMGQLTQGIMDFARVDGSNQVHDVLNLNEVIDALTFDLRLQGDQLCIESDLASIQFDTVNLRRVIENLVGNAVKYHDGVRPMKIIVAIHATGCRCHVTVTDNGPGIDLRFHKKIFEVFQSLSLSDTPESTGIGLSIVKRAIERNGGEISINSDVGRGSTFSFDWPISLEINGTQEESRAA